MKPNQKPKKEIIKNDPSLKILEKKDHSFLATLLAAIACAILIRSFIIEPFHIPSSSMKPELLIGDYVFVTKYSYGYSRYSFPFGINFFEGRVFKSTPKRGDVVVFRLPSNPSINYIKRVVGLPGDKLQMIDGVLYINEKEVKKTPSGIFKDEADGEEIDIDQFTETFSEGKKITTLDYTTTGFADNTRIYEVPENHYFMMGDNRDNSQDSRFIDQVGYVPQENLVGKARLIFMSVEKPIWQFWHWITSIRFNRIFKIIN